MSTVVAFDIETVPDAGLLRLSMDKPDAGDEEIIELAQQEALEKSGGRSDFIRPQFHKVVVVSIAMRIKDRLLINSKCPPEQDEAEVVRSFFNMIDKHTPTLVSWNGSGFDLPVLSMRAMHHGIVAEGYWQGPGDKWSQYTSRYHDAHLDLMDILGHRQISVAPKLETIALSCGLPGKMGKSGSEVLEMYQSGRYSDISAYCETDALNCYLLWLRYMLVSGRISPKKYEEEQSVVDAEIASTNAPHLMEFGKLWVSSRKALSNT